MCKTNYDRDLNLTNEKVNFKICCSERSCDLHCESTTPEKEVKYFGKAADGTECDVLNNNGRCIQGECNVSCVYFTFCMTFESKN